MSWPRESQRHAMSSRGVPTAKYRYNARGSPRVEVGLPQYTKQQIEHLSSLAQGKEWIAELSIINGEVIIDDIQVSDKIDQSNLRWNIGDNVRNVGYIHNHPPGIIPEFSAQDFILAFNIHELRQNKDKYPYTIMGVVYPIGETLKIKLYGINPTPERLRQFEEYRDIEATEEAMQPLLEEMKRRGELLDLKMSK